jgi:uncharacterized coiled-coil DUF342 family protein
MALTNAQKLQEAIKGVSKLISIEAQYRVGKIILHNDEEIDIPSAKITALKQKFATIRTEVKAYLDDITP